VTSISSDTPHSGLRPLSDRRLLRQRLHLVPGRVLRERTQRYLRAAPRLLGLLALASGEGEGGGAEPERLGRSLELELEAPSKATPAEAGPAGARK